MKEWIYQENGKYYRELTDLIGISVSREEISKEEYLRNRNKRDMLSIVKEYRL